MNRRRFLTLIAGGKKKPFDPDRLVLLVDSEESGVSGSDQFEITGAEVSTGTTFPVRFSPEADPFDFTDVTVDVSDPTITFPSAGRYFVQIGGALRRVQFDGGDRDKLIEVVQWGDLTWSSFFDAFNGCNFVSLPKGAITGNLSSVTIFTRTFLDNNIEEIDSKLFSQAVNAEDFQNVFQGNNLTSLPKGLFDKNIKATNLRRAFRFNSITSIPEGLFNNNPLIGNFDGLFEGSTLDTADLSRLYCELSVFNENTNVPFHGGSGNYDPALNFVVDGQTINTGDARDVLAIDRGWTLTDGGAI